MSVRTENKPLTEAQREHLLAIVTEKQRVDQLYDSFVGYLAAEHNAPSKEGWTKIDPVLGFVREVAATEEEDNPDP